MGLNPGSPQRPLTFLVGPLLTAALAAVSLAVVIGSPLAMFPEIQQACLVTDLPYSDCVAGARTAGFSNLAGFVLLIIVTLCIILRRRHGSLAPPLSVPPLLTILFLIFCFALILIDLVGREWGTAYASRIDELKHFSNYISLENLLWPLLVQLVLLESDWRLRSAITAALLLIVTLTIYRTADLTILIFGFVLPLVYLLWDARRAAWPRSALRPLASRVIVVVLVGGAFAWNGLVDTKSRAVEAESVIAGGAKFVQLNAMTRFRQRLAFPLYQAAIVRNLSEITAMPTILDEIERKLRLSDRPNLNEFVYNIIEPGGAGLGETTSLYYGEGAAYFRGLGLVWALGAPLLFVLVWLAVTKRRLAASAVLSIALWRSSFAGLITILPALVVQLSALFAMTGFSKLDKLPAAAWIRAPIVSRLAAALLLAAVVATTVAQAWATVDEPQRKALAQLTFAAKYGCAFDPTNIKSLPKRVDQAVAMSGLAVASSLLASTPERLDLVLPYGRTVKTHLPGLIAAVSPFIQCEAANESSPVAVSGVQTVSIPVLNPLGLVALAALLLAAIVLAQVVAGRSVFPGFAQYNKGGSAIDA